jgi:hypothetical protein
LFSWNVIFMLFLIYMVLWVCFKSSFDGYQKGEIFLL